MHSSDEPILKNLEIAGFKSFGARKKLSFSKGITAIVGPNGSGKSNVADALRWVLGEQRTSRLRGGKSEELIFHGTEGKPQASLAEVSILLNNQKGKFALQAGEIEITRQLYRSGESDYRLNGRKVNYSKVEELLAQAGIGKNSYAVISQGTIDQLLTAAGSERKMLFDEAAGIRQFDIKRSVAKRKLAQAQLDLEKVSAIVTELEPNKQILQKQTEIVAKREEMQKNYNKLQLDYITYWQKEYAELTKRLKHEIETNQTKLIVLEKELAITKHNSQNQASDKKIKDLKQWQTKNNTAENEKAKIQKEIRILEFKINELQNQNSIFITIEPKVLEQRINDQHKLKQSVQKKIQVHTSKVKKFDEAISDINDRLKVISDKLNEMHSYLDKNQKKEFLHQASGLVTTVRTQLRNATPRRQIDETMQHLTKIIHNSLENNVSELALSIGKLQIQISSCMAEREEIVESQTQEVIKLRSLELDLTAIDVTLVSLSTELVEAQKSVANKKNIIKELDKIKRQLEAKFKTLATLNSQTEVLNKKIIKLQQELNNPVSADTFTQFEQVINSKKTIEWQMNTAQQKLEGVTIASNELKKQVTIWFANKLPNLPNTAKRVELEDIRKLESELGLIEQIDQATLGQAEELSERITFLQSQQKDLTTAIKETEDFIKKLESETKDRFMKNFAKINTQFQNYFSILFDGGVAKLQLSSKEEFGIEIFTTPPGKRTHSVMALSGGEKALASVALLAAILVCNPSPFIFLDEVDAALDDENSSRFNKILKDLSKKSQIVVITHNHETMQAASNLFGITTSQKGDSEVLHINLQQADDIVQKSEAAKPVDKVQLFK